MRQTKQRQACSGLIFEIRPNPFFGGYGGHILHDGASGTGRAGLLICINEAERRVFYTGLKDWTKGPTDSGRR
ncbi:hypothetical protein [Acidomonas methanolica]|uniref:hypothetical protein n=1 Tax=Acidomonas methanolica TaxID=437 RepID=UPI00211A7108|nr:hypothetical protein [Acidomonas methanolica]MCQ9155109.1 hypothetical protein [Acidomonas methanolica]